MKDVPSAVEFAVEVERSSSVVGGGVELDSVSVEKRKICLEAADFVEADAAVADLDSVDNEADVVAARKEQREQNYYY